MSQDFKKGAITSSTPNPSSKMLKRKLFENSSASSPKPFSFYDLDKKREIEKRKKIEGIRKKLIEVKPFKASPMPDLNKIFKPNLTFNFTTGVNPFNLDSVKRHYKKIEDFKKLVEDEIQKGKEMAVFKANLRVSALGAPFVPDKSKKPLTVPTGELHSSERAIKRREYDNYIIEKKKDQEELQRKKDEDDEKELQREKRELRAKLVHRANPMPRLKPKMPKQSRKPLTVPMTPQLGPQKKRLCKAFSGLAVEDDEDEDSTPPKMRSLSISLEDAILNISL